MRLGSRWLAAPRVGLHRVHGGRTHGGHRLVLVQDPRPGWSRCRGRADRGRIRATGCRTGLHRRRRLRPYLPAGHVVIDPAGRRDHAHRSGCGIPDRGLDLQPGPPSSAAADTGSHHSVLDQHAGAHLRLDRDPARYRSAWPRHSTRSGSTHPRCSTPAGRLSWAWPTRSCRS